MPKKRADYLKSQRKRKRDTPRTCLKCGCQFMAVGLYNRICSKCHYVNEQEYCKRRMKVV